jgi:hypothetical protein
MFLLWIDDILALRHCLKDFRMERSDLPGTRSVGAGVCCFESAGEFTAAWHQQLFGIEK